MLHLFIMLHLSLCYTQSLSFSSSLCYFLLLSSTKSSCCTHHQQADAMHRVDAISTCPSSPFCTIVLHHTCATPYGTMLHPSLLSPICCTTIIVHYVAPFIMLHKSLLKLNMLSLTPCCTQHTLIHACCNIYRYVAHTTSNMLQTIYTYQP